MENEQIYPKPDNNMALAIFTTLCCCLPLGIFAIIKANDVNKFYLMKQYGMAMQAANDAKKWSFIGIGIGLVLEVIYFAIYGIAFFSQLTQ